MGSGFRSVPTFLYGTLLDDVLRARLVGRDTIGVAAHLNDHHVVSHRDAYVPALVACTGARCDGLLVTDLSEAEQRRIDVYEDAFHYTVHTLPVSADGQEVLARVYMPEPCVSLSAQLWSLVDWQATQGPLSRERALEIAAADPPLDAAQLRREWKMIGARAAARLRARQEEPPSALRYTAQPGDHTVVARRPLFGSFFKFAGFDLQHRTFQQTTSPVLEREVMIGPDAALVLPYDPRGDCVLLVEQFRTGPMMRGARNPWSLEPVAGMIDPGETPEEAAIRETEEEAGLQNVALEKMFSCYASPGGATDYFYCYLAMADLPAPTTYTGGLAEEHEDLRLHVLSFANAFALIDTGEANVGPLITMLMWLSWHRERLRAAA